MPSTVQETRDNKLSQTRRDFFLEAILFEALKTVVRKIPINRFLWRDFSTRSESEGNPTKGQTREAQAGRGGEAGGEGEGRRPALGALGGADPRGIQASMGTTGGGGPGPTPSY